MEEQRGHLALELMWVAVESEVLELAGSSIVAGGVDTEETELKEDTLSTSASSNTTGDCRQPSRILLISSSKPHCSAIASARRGSLKSEAASAAVLDLVFGP